MQNDDLLGAIMVSLFASTVLLAYHKTPNVNEALHYYKENNQMLFIAMRTCQMLITTTMVMNMKFIVGWMVQIVWQHVLT